MYTQLTNPCSLLWGGLGGGVGGRGEGWVGAEGVKTATIWGQGVAKRRVRNYLPQAQAILTPGKTG
jgi:hypothetical protein